MLGIMPATNGGSDLSLSDDDWLRSAVWLSLGTDARARADDVLPDGGTDKRGWWGDTYRDRQIGSRLWLLAREKQLPETLRRAEEYTREALQWLLDQNIATTVAVSGGWAGSGRLDLSVAITRPNGQTFRYSYLWSSPHAI